MKLRGWKVTLGIILLLSSITVYTVQLLVFRRPEDTYFYMLQDLAFLPVQVLLVTMILDQLFKRREKLSMQKKMNMVIGAFFSEVGTPLLKMLPAFDTKDGEIHKALRLGNTWKEKEFHEAREAVKHHDFAMDSTKGDLEGLTSFVKEKRIFLLGLLENPNLLEHDTFTELLWGVFHMTEELSCRPSLANLPKSDYAHLSNDIKRAYVILISEWLWYNRHLQEDYPYIFSLVVRTNPFNPDACVEVTQ